MARHSPGLRVDCSRSLAPAELPALQPCGRRTGLWRWQTVPGPPWSVGWSRYDLRHPATPLSEGPRPPGRARPPCS